MTNARGQDQWVSYMDSSILYHFLFFSTPFDLVFLHLWWKWIIKPEDLKSWTGFFFGHQPMNHQQSMGFGIFLSRKPGKFIYKSRWAAKTRLINEDKQSNETSTLIKSICSFLTYRQWNTFSSPRLEWKWCKWTSSHVGFCRNPALLQHWMSLYSKRTAWSLFFQVLGSNPQNDWSWLMHLRLCQRE